MKAVILTKYGSPEALIPVELDNPIPSDNEILIRIHAASVTAGDCELRRLKLPLGLSTPLRLYAGWKKPKRLKILGQELSGEVVEVGSRVSTFKAGDFIFGTTGIAFGAYAEYICKPEHAGETQGAITVKPDNLSFEEAAALPTAGMEALHYIRRSKLSSEQKVLIIGAGGSIGTIAVQLVKSIGAEVTAVDGIDKLDMLRKLGADYVIDYDETDYTRSDKSYDLIIDVVGKKSVLRKIKLLKKGGYYFLAYAAVRHIFLGILTGLFFKRKIRIESSNQTREELNELTKLIEKGGIKVVIDKIFPLEQASTAHNYADGGSKKGNIVLRVTE